MGWVAMLPVLPPPAGQQTRRQTEQHQVVSETKSSSSWQRGDARSCLMFIREEVQQTLVLCGQRVSGQCEQQHQMKSDTS
jgi:hypothetical protein